ncbi:MAG: hypothetical protein KIS73_22835 [Enhydrobacter sp.]|nr:hypothetical protein [Enhydrobacter sp.]
MFAALLLRQLARASLLALAAWVLTAGVASAHPGHGAHAGVDTRHATEAASSRPALALGDPAADRAEPAAANEAFARHHEGSCPAGTDAGHSGSCCTIACHAAMAPTASEPWIGFRALAPPVAGLSDRLEGRTGDRSERPPRHA